MEGRRMQAPHTRQLVAIAILLMLATGRPALAETEIVKILVRGDTIPGTSETLLLTEAPTINDAGRLAFLASPGDGLWSLLRTTDTGAVELVARTGDQVPGLPAGVSYWLLGYPDPFLSNSGHLVFFSLLGGPGVTDANDELIVRIAPSGEVDALVREGDAAPHVGPGVSYVGVDDGRGELAWSLVLALALNDEGDLLVQTRVTGGSVTPDDNTILQRLDTAGTFTTLLREGSPAPGTPQLDVQEYFFLSTGYSAAGDILMGVSLSGPGIGAGNDSAILGTSSSGILSVIAQEGNSVPEAGPDVFLADIGDYATPRGQNALGQAAMTLRLEGAGVSPGDAKGLFWFDGLLSLLVREGDALPDVGNEVLTSLNSVGTPIPNRFGHVVLEATVGAQSTLLVFDADTGAARVVVRQNSAVPGRPNLAFLATYRFERATLNDRGDVAFQSRVEDVVTEQRQRACFRERDGELETLLAPGDAIRVAPGDTRFVVACEAHALNRHGDVAMSARLIGNGRGIFVARAPPIVLPALVPGALPVCALVLALSGCAAGLRRRAHGKNKPDRSAQRVP